MGACPLLNQVGPVTGAVTGPVLHPDRFVVWMSLWSLVFSSVPRPFPGLLEAAEGT